MKMTASEVTVFIEPGDPVQIETKTGGIHIGTISSHSNDGRIAVINSAAGQKEVALSETANLFVPTSKESGMLMSAPKFFISGGVLAVAGTVTGAMQNPNERPAAAPATKPPFTFVTFGVSSYLG